MINIHSFKNSGQRQSYLASLRVFLCVVTLEKAGPAPLLLHYATWLASRLAQHLTGQLHLSIVAFGHVHGTQQRLNDSPASWGVAQTWCRFTDSL